MRKEQILAPKFDRPALLFCATQRSGSTMVVDDFQNLTGRGLTQTEGFYHLTLSPGARAANPGLTWDKALDLVTAHRKDEPLFFDKVMFHYLGQLSQMIDPARHDPMCTPFAEYFAGATWVHIRRANIFEQTVSKYLAETLNVWNSRDVKGPDFNAEVAFDLGKARMHMRALLREDQQWQSFFAKHRITPVEIYYEDAASNFPGYLAPLLKQLGLAAESGTETAPETDAAPALPRLRRMEKVGNARNRVLAEILHNMTLRDLASTAFEMPGVLRDKSL